MFSMKSLNVYEHKVATPRKGTACHVIIEARIKPCSQTSHSCVITNGNRGQLVATLMAGGFMFLTTYITSYSTSDFKVLRIISWGLCMHIGSFHPDCTNCYLVEYLLLTSFTFSRLRSLQSDWRFGLFRLTITKDWELKFFSGGLQGATDHPRFLNVQRRGLDSWKLGFMTFAVWQKLMKMFPVNHQSSTYYRNET